MVGLAALTATAAVALGAVPATADELPSGYAYELVAPPNSYGQKVTAGTIAPDGNGVVLTSSGALSDAGNSPDIGGSFYTYRTDQGWTTVPLIPPASLFPTWSQSSAQGIDSTADGRTALWWLQKREDKNTRRFTPVRTGADGDIEIAGPTVDGLADGGPATTPIATSADLRTIVFESPLRNFTTDGALDNRLKQSMGLYVSRPSPDALGEFRVRQVAFKDGAPMNRTCQVILGSDRSARGAVSEDGYRVFFTFKGGASCVAAANQRVWVRDGDADAVDLSESKCTTGCDATASPAFFEAASYDGQRVYFTTEQKLLNGDQDDSSRADLYVHDEAYATNSRLRAVTASGLTGQGAGVLGVVRASDDGSYVYFVANGRALAGENTRGESPQPGDNNLYVYHRPRSPLSAPETIHFVGRLDNDDVNRSTQFSLLNIQNRPVVISSGGRYLLFAAYSDLTDEKLPGDTRRDLYRYDVTTDELTRIWSTDPQHNGVARTDGVNPSEIGPKEGNADGARQKERRGAWAMSDDGGTVAFSTAERLSTSDVNDLRDVYMWREDTGQITLLSGGRSIFDARAGGVSRGGDVFFVSDAPLVPQHRSGVLTTFVARQGGGFAPPPPPPVPCSGDLCQGPETPVPGPFTKAGSSTFVGGGNVALPSGTPKPNQQTKVRVAKVKTVRRTSTRLQVKVPGKGKIGVTGSGLVRASKAVGKAGTYRVLVRLSKRTRRTLTRKGRVSVRVSVRFTPSTGKPSVARESVTFKTAKRRSSTASSRSVRRVSVLSSSVRKGR